LKDLEIEKLIQDLTAM